MKTQQQTDSKVFSYIRWSKPDQDLGDSERRQLEMTKRFAKRSNLPFDETLHLQDEGLSGFHGTHRKRGALGRFLLRVESGDVPAGSVLVVERIDRLSREGILTTLKTSIDTLWEHGITFATVSPEQTYPPGCDNEPKFFALLLYLKLAYDESKQKSDRIKEIREHSRKEAKDNGKKINGQFPYWLNAVRDTNENITGFKVIPEAVETIKMMFDLRLSGMGKLAIAQKLNKCASWTPPPKRNRVTRKLKVGGWRETYVQSILQNKAVIGQHQLHKIVKGERVKVGDALDNYFPRIVKDSTFFAVQKMFEKNRGKGGRHGKVRNLFTHIIRCGYCGGSEIFVNGGSKKNNPNYLMCDKYRLKNGCSRNSIRYDEVESIILSNCQSIRPEQVLPNKDKQQKVCNVLRQRIASCEVELQSIERQIDNYMANLGDAVNPKVRERCNRKITELDEKSQTLQNQQKEDRRELRNAESNRQSVTKWQEGLKSLQKAIQKNNASDLRMKLRMHLAEFIESIEIFGKGSGTIDVNFVRLANIFKNEKSKSVKTKDLTAFAQYIKKTYAGTKQSRFIRIHFKSGTVVDFWPDDSVPDSLTFYVDKNNEIEWSDKRNKFESLWSEFVIS